MSATVMPVPGDVFVALRGFIQGVVGPGVEVVRGMDNRVPLPTGPFVLMTPLYQLRLATNVDTYVDSFPDAGPAAQQSQMSTRFDVQIDCYGPTSGQWAAAISTLFRDEYACNALAPVCQPLYADEARQMPLTADDQQYLERWLVTASLEYDPVVTIAQQFAGALSVDLIDVDVRWPP